MLLILPTPEGYAWQPELSLSAPGFEPRISCTHECTYVEAANVLRLNQLSYS